MKSGQITASFEEYFWKTIVTDVLYVLSFSVFNWSVPTTRLEWLLSGD